VLSGAEADSLWCPPPPLPPTCFTLGAQPHSEHGLRSSSRPASEAGGGDGGRLVQERVHAALSPAGAQQQPAREARVPLRPQEATTQVRATKVTQSTTRYNNIMT